MFAGAINQDIRLSFNPPNSRRKLHVIPIEPIKYFMPSQPTIHEKWKFFSSFKQKINELEIISQIFYALSGNCCYPANVGVKGCVILSSVTWKDYYKLEMLQSLRKLPLQLGVTRASRSNKRNQRWYQLGHCIFFLNSSRCLLSFYQAFQTIWKCLDLQVRIKIIDY